MRIAVIGLYHNPLAEPFVWGLESFTFRYVHSLIERWHEVDVYAKAWSWPGFHCIPFEGESLRTAYDIIWWYDDVKAWFAAEFVDYALAMDKIAKGDYDIIHNHSLHHYPILAWGLIKVPPMVTTFHVHPFVEYKSAVHALQWEAIASGKNRNAFVSISNYIAQTRERIGQDTKVINNWVELDRRKFFEYANNDQPYFARAWRVTPEKWTHLAVQAAIRAWVHLKIAWSVHNDHYFKTKIEPHLSDTIEYVGALSQAQLNEHFGNAQAKLFTSIWDEPFGLVLIEALASGCPVITFESGEAGCIINQNVWAVVWSEDVDAMASEIWLIDKVERSACRARAEEEYSRSVMMDKYEEFYNEII